MAAPADSIISLADAQAAAAHLPDADLLLMPDESHLGGFAETGQQRRQL